LIDSIKERNMFVHLYNNTIIQYIHTYIYTIIVSIKTRVLFSLAGLAFSSSNFRCLISSLPPEFISILQLPQRSPCSISITSSIMLLTIYSTLSVLKNCVFHCKDCMLSFTNIISAYILTNKVNLLCTISHV